MESQQTPVPVPVAAVQASEDSMELLQVLIKLADPQPQSNKQQGQSSNRGGDQEEQLQAVASIVTSDASQNNAITVVEANQMAPEEGTVTELSAEGMENVVVHFTEADTTEDGVVVPVTQSLEEGEVIAVTTDHISQIVERREVEREPEEEEPEQEFTGKIFRYKCKMCAMMCESLEALERHMEIEMMVKKIVCQDCGKRFKTKEGYRCHRRIHTGETPYKCDECDLKFNNRSAFRYHQELKHSDEEFLCLHCAKTFQTRQCLRKHLVLAHGKKLSKGRKKAKDKKKKLKKLKVKEEKGGGDGIQQEGVQQDGVQQDGAQQEGAGVEITITGEKVAVIKEKKKKKKKKKKKIRFSDGEIKLRRPQKTAHLIRAHKCEYCPGQYTLRKNLFKHIRAKHPDKAPPKPTKISWSCDYCGAPMKTKTYKREHERIHTGERPFSCRLGCEKTFARSGARNEHERSVHLKENKATCEVCNKTFDRRELRHHATIHTGEKPFRCPYCQNSYTQKKIMNKHIRRAHPGCEIPAPIPRKRSTFKKIPQSEDHALIKRDGDQADNQAAMESMKKRILQDTGTVEMQVYKCKYCDKLFNNTQHLTNHENIHIQTKHYQCGTCGKMFKRPEGLTRHIGKHTGGFQCTTCGLNLPTFTKLQVHEEEHLFKCKMCKRKHETKAELKEHLKVHLKNTDRYQCMHCFKILATKSSLREHEKIHTEKVKCSFCDKEFVSHYMKKHLRTHSGDHPYLCKHCPDRRYTTPNALRVHMRRRHSAQAARTDYQATIVINPEVLVEQVNKAKGKKKGKEDQDMIIQQAVAIHDIEIQPQEIQLQVSQQQEIQHQEIQLQVAQAHGNQAQIIQQVQVIPQEVVHQEVVPHHITQQQIIQQHLPQTQQVHVTHEGPVTFGVPTNYQPPSYSQVTQQPTDSHITLTNVPQQQVYINIPYNTQPQPPQQQQQQQQQQPQVQHQFHY